MVDVGTGPIVGTRRPRLSEKEAVRTTGANHRHFFFLPLARQGQHTIGDNFVSVPLNLVAEKRGEIREEKFLGKRSYRKVDVDSKLIHLH